MGEDKNGITPDAGDTTGLSGTSLDIAQIRDAILAQANLDVNKRY